MTRALRKYGFSGQKIEDRARDVHKLGLYNVVVRNFSRNVHGADYAEYLMNGIEFKRVSRDAYLAVRDHVALSTAVSCTVGIIEPTARSFRLPQIRKITTLKRHTARLEHQFLRSMRP